MTRDAKSYRARSEWLRAVEANPFVQAVILLAFAALVMAQLR